MLVEGNVRSYSSINLQNLFEGIVDLGVNNRVVGHDADDFEPPKGIGQWIKEIEDELLEP